MNLLDQEPLPICVTGVTDKMKNMLQYFFRNHCNDEYEIVYDESARIAIIDQDTVDGRKLIYELPDKCPGRPVITLSFDNKGIENTIFVQKPVNPEKLMLAIGKAKEILQSKSLNQSVAEPVQEELEDTTNLPESSNMAVPPEDDESLWEDDSLWEDGTMWEDEEASEQASSEQASSEQEASEQESSEQESSESEASEQASSEQESSEQEASEQEASEQKASEREISEQEISEEGGIADEAIAEWQMEITREVEILQSDQFTDSYKKVDTEPDHSSKSSRSNSRSESGYIGSAPDIDPDDPAQLARAQYQPEIYFQYHIHQASLKAKKSHKAVLISIFYGSLIILPDAKYALIDIKESKLRAFCALPIADKTLNSQLLDDKDLKAYEKKSTTISIEQLLWKAAIWASRGRVPAGTSLHKKVYFQNWTDISNSLLFPNALLIADLWSEGPCSLIETAKKLQIPQRFVFAFYSACHSIGIVYVSAGSENDEISPKSEKNKGSGNLLEKLIKQFPGSKGKKKK